MVSLCVLDEVVNYLFNIENEKYLFFLKVTQCNFDTTTTKKTKLKKE